MSIRIQFIMYSLIKEKINQTIFLNYTKKMK